MAVKRYEEHTEEMYQKEQYNNSTVVVSRLDSHRMADAMNEYLDSEEEKRDNREKKEKKKSAVRNKQKSILDRIGDEI